ncbi:MAG TPA: hypothetical protein ENK50_05800 [Sedimenticola sp.]|nr:hypothetical protein [Sedimenticola sp.]
MLSRILQRWVQLVFPALLLVAGGCAVLQPLPTTELQTYREAVLETRRIGDQVLKTWDKAAREAKARDELRKRQASGRDAIPFPARFDARGSLATQQAPDAVAVRMLALDTIVRYTDLLVTLAEGKSVGQVQGSAEQLRAGLQTLTGLLSLTPIPGLAAAGPLIQTMAGALEQARLRLEFERAVEEGQPAVAAILDFLIDDSSDYYTTLFAQENEKRLKLRRRIIDAAGSVVKIVHDHAMPTDPNLLVRLGQRIEAVLASLVPPVRAPVLTPGGGNAFSNLAQSQVMTAVESMESANRRRIEIVEGMNAYYRLLEEYVRLLDQTRNNLHDLSLALERPMELQPAFQNTLMRALRARRDIRIVQDNL